jgi:hypothetical protein
MDTAKPSTPPTSTPTANSATPAATPATKPIARPSTRPAAPVRVTPMSSRAIAASLLTAFLAGGLIAGAVPVWVFIVIGLAVGALALFAMDRFGRSNG